MYIAQLLQLACIIIQSNQRVGRMVWSRTMGLAPKPMR